MAVLIIYEIQDFWIGYVYHLLNLQSLVDKECGLKKVNYKIIQNDRFWCNCRSV